MLWRLQVQSIYIYIYIVYGSVRRWSILIIVQRYTTQSSLFISLQVQMFRVSTTPIIRSTQNCNYSLRYWSYFLCSYLPPTWPGVHKTVTTASVTGHVFCADTSLQRGQASPPHYGCGWHPEHVEWTCRIINRLFCVASRWTIINILIN